MKRVLVAFAILLGVVRDPASAGSIFLTGHDSDYHAAVPTAAADNNAVGAQRINQVALGYVMDPLFNTFVANGIGRFLFVEANKADANVAYTPFLGLDGIVASGFVEGVDFEQHGAPTLDAELDGLGTEYSALVVASDCGGSLRQQELDILNGRSADIISFLNAGGGLFAMAESNLCGPPNDPANGITPNGGHFDFLPFVISSTLDFDENDPAFALSISAYGLSLGLTLADVQGNFAHNVFGGTFGMEVVDSVVANGNRVPLTLATRKRVSVHGVPEPGALALGVMGLGFGVARLRRARLGGGFLAGR